MKPKLLFATLAATLLAFGCATFTHPGKPEPRQGDEIVAAGQLFHTGTRVVLWMDPGGYDAYRIERRFAPLNKSGWDTSHEEVKTLNSPNRYGMRVRGLTTNEIEQVRGGGWDLPLLQKVVDQFVLHFDVAGTSRTCFHVLHDDRDLSVHFMLDVDGTIYQTLDLKERAWHATTSNDRSVGIEIANIGAYRSEAAKPLQEWYHTNAAGQVCITVPERFGDVAIRNSRFVGHPARNEPIRGNIQGEDLVQYDYTPEQYAALIKLTATLCKIFPKIKCQYPVDADGKLITHKLPKDQLDAYEGVLGHYHIQTDKVDPGPAMDWNKVIGGAQKILGVEPKKLPTS
jgi:N-acetyl-anhydromuramyl-L-alanine amidase AmpD